jgi:predicted CXXCH cytochrome family protein
MKLWAWTAATLLLFGITISSEANIASSKHNLSASGTGTVKATSETELCVFCHIPHNAKPEAPLWNRTVTTAAYTMYSSDYLSRASYAVPTDVGQRSRLCLSCHDGTVAVGSVYTVRGTAGTIAMAGVDGAGKMMGTEAGYLGVDLRNDHPISIKYDTGITIPFGSGSRGMELNPSAPPISPRPYTGVKLYGMTSGTIKGYVECTSCHDPHNDANPDFLVVSNAAGALCTTCHSKTGWSGSNHRTQVSEGCMSCHKNHSGAGIPYLLKNTAENSCYSGASATACHASGTNNIQTIFNRWVSHPVATTAGKHKNLDVLYDGDLGSGNRHAACVDCHNPHQAKKLPERVATGSWYPSSISSGSNLVANSGPLTGVSGLALGSSANWTARTSFTTKESATYEYEICYKCHSSYAIRNSVTPVSSWIGPSGTTITDQAWEFNPANRSSHPVEASLGSRSSTLASVQLNSTWSANRGNQTMYCSDCHGANDEPSTNLHGPHGSMFDFMLKGPNKIWPGTFTLSSATTGLFCLNCHPIRSGKETYYNNVHSKSNHQSVTCVRCHTAVPHGSRLSRMIAYAPTVVATPPWGAPYSNQSMILGFKKATSPTGYDKTYCQTSGSGCGDDHNFAVSGAEQ